MRRHRLNTTPPARFQKPEHDSAREIRTEAIELLLLGHLLAQLILSPLVYAICPHMLSTRVQITASFQEAAE